MSPIWCTLMLFGLIVPSSLGQPSQADPNIDQILSDLRILTNQQLEQPASTLKPKIRLEPERQTPVKAKLASSPSSNQKSLQIPVKYDPNKIPRPSKSRPLTVKVNMTVLHVSLDKNENVVNLDLELREHWKDRRLRIHKTDKKEKDEDDDDIEAEEDDEIEGTRKLEYHLLERDWAARLWHPVSRFQNNAEVIVSYLINESEKKLKNSDEMSRQKTIEQEYLIENILILRNESSAFVYMTMRLRVALPMYECKRDETSLFPFDRIRCTFFIASSAYDKRMLEYNWDQVKWEHNGYQRGEFYLKKLDQTIENRLLIGLEDKDNQEHSTMRVEIFLKRQIGDYLLNVYMLQIFLLALCIATFWISISNIVIRLALSIIVLIIIKFQTIQTLRDERLIVSALSIWTFGLSILVILCLLLHILSYYSMQHKWNDKILTKLISDRSQAFPDHGNGSSVDLEMATSGTSPSLDKTSKWNIKERLEARWGKMKRSIFLWLNSVILSNAKEDGYDLINLVDILSRTVLLIIYILFVSIYFLRYVL